ncbi:DEAD/DEAH box helicase [Rhodococcus opacus]|uniref:DEAD/DEAH box helicase n=1 Tax=Rhodococcus opacus TaxID=37919 RepID=A0AAX3YRU3_RHOOP|nr:MULTISPECIES: DEAD/DEAH box helicase [Rhodococcus]MCZ4584392.1 DEAD/DEAH box helicase [Rhodococcus opacus]MDI9940990.1 DEAD/DEAH box helicase [Rhodococcus sp. IEGM 1351]WKN59237.1 DEAD/DEAH box helicase [Rhodococcus opacus]WLF50724.1 DEAD/DEAH box helicase [Rhodococcus opacus]
MTNAVQTTSAPLEQTETETPDQNATVTFAEIGLPAPLVQALARNSITVPSPIQALAVPDALAGTNVLGRAQTGSGKTLAFGLPMLTRLSRHEDRPAPKRPRALVLVPTRELAFQVVDSLNSYAGAMGLTVRPAVGGTPFSKQVDQLRRGVDILVATPGRLNDHLRQGTCILDSIEITALDEADQMADMGFLPEVRAILGETRADGQRLLFSATLDREVQSLVRQFLPDHVQHSTEDGRASVDTMEHYVLLVDRGQKDNVLAEIGARDGRTIMFARTKLGCEGITDRLRAVGIAAEALHGGKAQNQRTRVLERFKNGRTPVLVATDVAARGIHVDGIDLVVHVDPPADHKDYLHRAGRTARAGEKGTVVAIVLPNQKRTFRRLTGMAGVDATAVPVTPGSEKLASITGAKAPSGEPVRDTYSRGERGGDRKFGDRGPRREGGYAGRDGGGYRGNRSDRGERSFGDRPSGGRSFEGRGPRRDQTDNRSGGYRGDRPQRDGDNRGGGYRGDRDNRTFTDRAPRRDFGDSAPRREYGGGSSAPRRDFGDRGDSHRGTGERSFDRSAPRRDFGDNRGAAGGFRRDDRRPAAASERRPASTGGGFRSRTDRRSYDGFDGPRRERRS